MTRRRFRVLVLAALAGGGLGCALPEDNTALYILGAKTLSSSCMVEASEAGPFRTWGTLDLVKRWDYSFACVIRNQMTDTLTVQQWATEDLRVDTNVVRVTSVTVRYEPMGNLATSLGTVDTFETSTSGTAPSNALLAVVFPLLSRDFGERISGAMDTRSPETPFPEEVLLTRIQVSGKTLDGSPVSSGEFLFPLTVCKGCLLTFPPEAADPGRPNCRNEDGVSGLESPCIVGQDEPVDCRLCRIGKAQAAKGDCEPL